MERGSYPHPPAMVPRMTGPPNSLDLDLLADVRRLDAGRLLHFGLGVPHDGDLLEAASVVDGYQRAGRLQLKVYGWLLGEHSDLVHRTPAVTELVALAAELYSSVHSPPPVPAETASPAETSRDGALAQLLLLARDLDVRVIWRNRRDALGVCRRHDVDPCIELAPHATGWVLAHELGHWLDPRDFRAITLRDREAFADEYANWLTVSVPVTAGDARQHAAGLVDRWIPPVDDKPVFEDLDALDVSRLLWWFESIELDGTR